MMQDIFKEYEPLTRSFSGDSLPILLYTIAFVMIGLEFLLFGILCLTFSGKYTEKNHAYYKRRNIAYLIGASMATCGISRLIGIVCLYHNYAILNGIFGCITAIAGLILVIYTPYVMRSIKNASSIDDLHHSIKETKEKIEELKQTTEQLTKEK